MSEQRIEELEIKLAYQEQTLNALSDALISQQQQIELLKRDHERLHAKFVAMSDVEATPSAADEVPPHY